MPQSSQPTARLNCEKLEDRTTPTFITRPGPPVMNINSVNVQTAGLSIGAGNLLADNAGPLAQNEYVTGTGPGVVGTVRVWRLNGQGGGQSGTPAVEFVPFAGFTGGINVAVGDVLGDAAQEIITTVATSGPPHVKVFDASGNLLSSFIAFDSGFLGGLNVAVGNVLGGIGAGGFPGGAVTQNFKQEIILGAAAGGSPHIVVTDGAGTRLRSFLAFDLGYRGGVTVAAASIDQQRDGTFPLTGVDNRAYDEIIVGAATAIPHVKALEVWTGEIIERLSYFAFDPSIGQGVTVAAGSTDNARGAEIYVAQIAPVLGTLTQRVRVFNGLGQFQLDFAPYPATYTRVLNMTVSYLTSGLYNPADEDTATANRNADFLTQDLAIVSGDGPVFQAPRFLNGVSGRPAGGNGPP
jgi:hypothetical protein